MRNSDFYLFYLAEAISKRANKYHQQNGLNKCTSFIQNKLSQPKLKKMRVYLHIGEGNLI